MRRLASRFPSVIPWCSRLLEALIQVMSMVSAPIQEELHPRAAAWTRHWYLSSLLVLSIIVVAKGIKSWWITCKKLKHLIFLHGELFNEGWCHAWSCVSAVCVSLHEGWARTRGGHLIWGPSGFHQSCWSSKTPPPRIVIIVMRMLSYFYAYYRIFYYFYYIILSYLWI